ncbi:hypothetical protein IFM89_021461 [Coptis chinensis]|uniref:DUF4283 domain-containing protein n=1 Tax=Coptis chinensis TaxID=261450 RepID=A0A835ISE0_9MAGN|nr:hypothetical protein IFM89_021461 [Coptis chinensis]
MFGNVVHNPSMKFGNVKAQYTRALETSSRPLGPSIIMNYRRESLGINEVVLVWALSSKLSCTIEGYNLQVVELVNESNWESEMLLKNSIPLQHTNSLGNLAFQKRLETNSLGKRLIQFMIRLTCEEDWRKIWCGGLWRFKDQTLRLTKWTPEFDPDV